MSLASRSLFSPHKVLLSSSCLQTEGAKFYRLRFVASSVRPAMDSDALTSLILCGKSSAEVEMAESIRSRNSLKLPDNGAVSILLRSEIDLQQLEAEAFNVERFMKRVSTDRFGRFLIWSRRLPSTHDVISHNFSELPFGSVCVADVQSKGRGRSKNEWESPRGCLMFSFNMEMEDGRTLPLVQYVVSLAITEAIKDACHMNGLPCLDVKIKWPNDLYLNGLKVGGILCTSKYRDKKFNVSAGIGLNVHNEKPTTCLNAALREISSTANHLIREDLLANFFNKFEEFHALFINQGFKPLEELYYRTWLHNGQRVLVQENDGDRVEQNVVTIQGLTSSGFLLAIGDDGQMYELHPDGNSFDFFKGLVRRKLQ